MPCAADSYTDSYIFLCVVVSRLSITSIFVHLITLLVVLVLYLGHLKCFTAAAEKVHSSSGPSGFEMQALVKNETEVNRGRQTLILLPQHKTHWLTNSCFCSLERALLQELAEQGRAVGASLKQLQEVLQLHHTFKVNTGQDRPTPASSAVTVALLPSSTSRHPTSTAPVCPADPVDPAACLSPVKHDVTHPTGQSTPRAAASRSSQPGNRPAGSTGAPAAPGGPARSVCVSTQVNSRGAASGKGGSSSAGESPPQTDSTLCHTALYSLARGPLFPA